MKSNRSAYLIVAICSTLIVIFKSGCANGKRRLDKSITLTVADSTVFISSQFERAGNYMSSLQFDSNYYYEFDIRSNLGVDTSFVNTAQEATLTRNEIALAFHTASDNNPHDTAMTTLSTQGKINIDLRVKKLKKTVVQKMKEGNLLFIINDTMQVGVPERALLLVAIGEKDMIAADSISNQAYGDTESPSKVHKPATVSNTMIARLVDDGINNFKTRLTDADSIKSIIMSTQKYTVWEWMVTPLSEGTNSLTLTLHHVKRSLANSTEFVPSRSIKVYVTGTPTSLWKKIGYFFSNNWQWILTSLGGIVVFFYSMRRRTRNKGA